MLVGGADAIDGEARIGFPALSLFSNGELLGGLADFELAEEMFSVVLDAVLT